MVSVVFFGDEQDKHWSVH